MTELVFAVFDAASAADTAVQDLEVARIPSAVIKRAVTDDGTDDHPSANARPLVIVAVDEMHTPAITGILNQYGPLKLEQRAAQSRRR